MRFFTFAFKNVLRRRFRTLLTIAGLGVAVGAVVALVGISRGFEQSFLNLYQGHGIDVVVVRARLVDPTASSLDESLGDRIAALPQVQAVSATMLETISFPEANIAAVAVQGLDADSPMLEGYRRNLSGRALEIGDTKAVMLGSTLAKNLDKGLSDMVQVVDPEEMFQVVGIFETNNVYENGSMIVPLDQLQRVMQQPGQVTALNITLTDEGKAAADKACRQIEAIDSALSAKPTEDFVRSDARIQVAGAMAWSTSAIALVVGAIGMLNTMTTSVFERTKEIGILRAIGWRRSRVVRMILLEAVLLSTVGALLGTLGAVGLTRLLATVPAVSGTVSADIDPGVMALGVAIALSIGLLGAAAPAYRGARLLPTEALRHE